MHSPRADSHLPDVYVHACIPCTAHAPTRTCQMRTPSVQSIWFIRSTSSVTVWPVAPTWWKVPSPSGHVCCSSGVGLGVMSARRTWRVACTSSDGRQRHSGKGSGGVHGGARGEPGRQVESRRSRVESRRRRVAWSRVESSRVGSSRVESSRVESSRTVGPQVLSGRAGDDASRDGMGKRRAGASIVLRPVLTHPNCPGVPATALCCPTPRCPPDGESAQTRCAARQSHYEGSYRQRPFAQSTPPAER